MTTVGSDTNPNGAVYNPTNKIGPVFDELFRFRIGEMVTTHHTLISLGDEFELADITNPEVGSLYPTERRELGTPPKLTITERIVTECHGGAQLQYQVCGLVDGRRGNPVIVRLNEFELVPYGDAMDVLRGRAIVIRDARIAREEARKSRRD